MNDWKDRGPKKDELGHFFFNLANISLKLYYFPIYKFWIQQLKQTT